MKTRISVQERLKDLRVEQGLNLEELAHSRHGASLNRNPPIPAVTAAIDG